MQLDKIQCISLQTVTSHKDIKTHIKAKKILLLCGTIRGNFLTTAVSSCIMVSMCSVLRGKSQKVR